MNTPPPGLLSRDRIIAPPGFNRWRVPPASVAIHLCIGSVYAWSSFNPPLTRVLGAVAPAPDDWTIAQVVWVFTVAIVFLGLAAAVAGKWLEQVGPRAVGVLAACCWGGGFLVAAAGIALHQLWLLYLGYGVLGGCGLGLGYVSPVSTLIKWFPDRRGMAAGMAIMGFGGGAILGQPLQEALLAHYFRAPERLGTKAEVPVEVDAQGRLWSTAEGERRSVVVLTEAEARKLPGVEPGVYVAGTGSSGVAETFATLGVCYFLVMLLAAFSYRLPASDWKPAGWSPPLASGLISAHTVGVDAALRTPQFYLLWIVLCLNVSAGIGVLSVAKTMMSELFEPAFPALVTAGFASTFVLMIGVFNMLGRFFWASASDSLGRQLTYTLYFVLQIPLYVSIPWAAAWGAQTGDVVWLWYCYVAMLLIFTMYGGGFATIPAYLADLFGAKYVGGIHGRLLTAWSLAGVVGPLAVTSLRERALVAALHDLAEQVSPQAFQAEFGAPPTQLGELIASKTVTLARLMTLVPPGTPNPSFQLYETTMYMMAGLLIAALLANLAVRPVHPRHHAG